MEVEQEDNQKNIEQYNEIKVSNGTNKIQYINNILEVLKGNNIKLPFDYEQKTDLITGIYEGGFKVQILLSKIKYKVWECTIDLIDYFENNGG